MILLKSERDQGHFLHFGITPWLAYTNLSQSETQPLVTYLEY